MRWALARVTGSYGLALLTEDGLYAARDPLGNRPLALGRLPGGWMVASESCAFLTVGATFVRDVAPGEIVRLDEAGPVTVGRIEPVGREAGQAFCAFEYIYLARPDSQFAGRTVYEARYEMGRTLAGEQPADADLVAAVPDSGITAALGYAAVSGLPYREVLIKNRYVGRTFIHPGVESRGKVLALKFTPLAPIVAGQRIVLVDDSLVRGTTMRALVAMLRAAGAREVHLRIAAPAVRWPCFLGVDIPTTSELIAHDLDSTEVCVRVGADSLGYLSLDGLAVSVGLVRRDENGGLAEGAGIPKGDPAPEMGVADAGGRGNLCAGCFTGHYPIPIPREQGHGRREESTAGAGERRSWAPPVVAADGLPGSGRVISPPREMGVSR
jgi:amidophosphoribosyltransferase